MLAVGEVYSKRDVQTIYLPQSILFSKASRIKKHFELSKPRLSMTSVIERRGGLKYILGMNSQTDRRPKFKEGNYI